MNLDHGALLAASAGEVAIAVLALAAVGMVTVARSIRRVIRAELAWRRGPLLADDDRGLTALADAVHTPQALPGSTDWLYDMHPDAPRWED